MRKFLFLLVVMASSIIVNAKPDIHNFKNFVVGDNGTVTVVRTYKTTLDEASINKAIAKVLAKNDGILTLLSSENGLTKYQGQFQSQIYYNPMAGTTKRTLKFHLEVTVANNAVVLIMSDLVVQEDYIGYGAHTTMIDVTDKMVKFNKQLAIYNSPDYKKQAKSVRKEVEEVLDDTSDILSASDEELGNRLNLIGQNL